MSWEHIDNVEYVKQPVEWQSPTMTVLTVRSLSLLHRENLVTSKPEITGICGVPRPRGQDNSLVEQLLVVN